MSGITGTGQFVSGKPPGSYEYRVRACLGVSAPVCGDPSTATVTVVVGGGGGGIPATPHFDPPGPIQSMGTFSLAWSGSPTAEFYKCQTTPRFTH